MFASFPPRRLMLLATAMALSLVTALVIRAWVDNARRAAAAPVVQAETVAPLKMVMVAAKSLPAGHFIKAEDLAWQSWPDQNTPPAYMVQGAVAPDMIVGSVVRNGIAQGEPITDIRIVKKGDRGFLAAVLAPGFRAITVQLQPNAGLSGLVIPGDRVDLILTMTLPAAGKDAVERRVSETALQDIRVIAVDQRLDDQSTDAPTAKTTTLEVTPKQAEIVTLLTDMGKLSMTLRSVGSAENDALAHEPSITWDNEATDLPFLKHRQTAATGNPGGNDAVSVMRGTAKSVVDFSTGIARETGDGPAPAPAASPIAPLGGAASAIQSAAPNPKKGGYK